MEDWLPWRRPWVGIRSAPNAIMQPGSVTTSIIRFGDQKLTFTPNQKVASLRQAQSGFDEDCASSSFESLSKPPIRTPPIVIGKMQVQRTLVMGLKTAPVGQADACAGPVGKIAASNAAVTHRPKSAGFKNMLTDFANLPSYRFGEKADRSFIELYADMTYTYMVGSEGRN